jgi:hypothetical protein
MVEEKYIKLFNTHKQEAVKYIWVSKNVPIDAQIQDALKENKRHYMYAEIVNVFRLHSDELYDK